MDSQIYVNWWPGQRTLCGCIVDPAEWARMFYHFHFYVTLLCGLYRENLYFCKSRRLQSTINWESTTYLLLQHDSFMNVRRPSCFNLLCGKSMNTEYHHHQFELVGDAAAPVSVRQAVLFCALRSPDASPRLNWRRSSSTVLSQVCLGRPGRRLQFLGVGDMQAYRAREWSWDFSAHATWPNNLKRLVRTVSDSSGCPVHLRTS